MVDELSYPFYVKPIKLLTNVTSIKILQDLPANITEGVKFGANLTPVIQVFDDNGVPMEGKLIISLVCNYNGKDYPKRYIYVRKGYKSKRLLNPFPGIYNPDSDNPLSEFDPVNPILTNSNGIASLNDSYFSKYGPSGVYKLEFICDGMNIFSSEINVFIIFYIFFYKW